jgi:hypothetical protein
LWWQSEEPNEEKPPALRPDSHADVVKAPVADAPAPPPPVDAAPAEAAAAAAPASAADTEKARRVQQQEYDSDRKWQANREFHGRVAEERMRRKRMLERQRGL